MRFNADDIAVLKKRAFPLSATLVGDENTKKMQLQFSQFEISALPEARDPQLKLSQFKILVCAKNV